MSIEIIKGISKLLKDAYAKYDSCSYDASKLLQTIFKKTGTTAVQVKKRKRMKDKI
jgi:predicted nuclease of restriction endonuclease-like RecB superfamily